MGKVNFRVEIQEDFCGEDPAHLELTDLGPWGQYQTITNAPESVLEDLVVSGVLGPDRDRKVFYVDSSGDRDELVHEKGVFLTFAPARDGRTR